VSGVAGVSSKTTGYLLYGLIIHRYANVGSGLVSWYMEPTVFPTIEAALDAVKELNGKLGQITLHRQTEITYQETKTERGPIE
jgi:hypothetical protein